MSDFPVHSVASAPEGSRAALEAAARQFGFLPNLLGVLAGAPGLLKGYLALSELLDQSSLSPAERQVVLLSASTENDCRYCVAAHSAVAAGAGVPKEELDRLRAGQPLQDARLEALRRFTSALVGKRGWIGESELAAFRAAGYTQQQVLEVVLGVGMKTLSNYTNHIAETPLDAAFQSRRWEPAPATT